METTRRARTFRNFVYLRTIANCNPVSHQLALPTHVQMTEEPTGPNQHAMGAILTSLLDSEKVHQKGFDRVPSRFKLTLFKQLDATFKIKVIAGEAVDTVRRQMQRAGADLKGSLWALRGNEWNLEPEQQEERRSLCQRYKRLGRALTLRDALQDIYEAPKEDGPALLEQWCAWARRSRLKPFHKLAWTIKDIPLRPSPNIESFGGRWLHSQGSLIARPFSCRRLSRAPPPRCFILIAT